MKANPILEEVWRIKDQLAAEAGYDMDRYFDNLRKWMTAHPHTGPVIHNADELRRLVAEKEARCAAQPAATLNEEPPKSRQS